MEVNPGSKIDIPSIAEKNRIAHRVAQALVERDGFLLIGHRNPDEDCVASMVAFGLLASKLNKAAYIYLCGNVHEQFSYLLNICTYNSIVVLRDDDPLRGSIQAVVALDTPKAEMLETRDDIRELIADPSVLKIEIDHHLGSDSSYFGDEGYRFVAASSSASELVGYLALKMDEDPRFRLIDGSGGLLARNFVLAVLTGIIADSRMGKYLKTKRERWFYEHFSSLFDRLLAQKTAAGSGNFTSKEEVFEAIASLSSEEEDCYRRMMAARRRLGSLEYVLLGPERNLGDPRRIRRGYADHDRQGRRRCPGRGGRQARSRCLPRPSFGVGSPAVPAKPLPLLPRPRPARHARRPFRHERGRASRGGGLQVPQIGGRRFHGLRPGDSRENRGHRGQRPQGLVVGT